MNRSRFLVSLAVLATVSLAQAQTPLPAPTPELAPPVLEPGPAPEAPLPAAGPDEPPGRYWLGAEYAMFWMRGQSLPPLVTTSPAGTASGNAGLLGTPGATVLFGDSSSNTGMRSGALLSGGAWLDQNRTLGVQADFLDLEDKADAFSAASNGSQILARPFINSLTDKEAVSVIAFPGIVHGSISARSETDGLLGAEFLLRENLGGGDHFRVDVIGGWRFLRFGDNVDIYSSQTSVSPTSLLAVGTQINAADEFATKNTYNGFGVGLASDFWYGPLDLQLVAKISAGLNQEGIDIAGTTTSTVPGAAPVVRTGGLLALSNNIFHYDKDEGSAVPEVSCRVGYQITPNIRATVGYTLIIWDDVARAGDQINRVINPTLVPGFPGGPSTTPVPSIPLYQNNLYIQGLTLGMEVRF